MTTLPDAIAVLTVNYQNAAAEAQALYVHGERPLAWREACRRADDAWELLAKAQTTVCAARGGRRR